MRCTGYRPAPVRRSQAKVLYLATVPLRRPNVRISQRKLHPLVVPAQAGIQDPRLPSHHPPRQAPCGRGLAMRCTGYRPAPVRRSERGGALRRVSQHDGGAHETSIEIPPARHSGAGRNPEPTPAIAPPAQTGTPRPRPRHALRWVPAFAGTTVSSEGALSGDRAAPAAERSHLPAQAPPARHSGPGRNPEPTLGGAANVRGWQRSRVADQAPHRVAVRAAPMYAASGRASFFR